MDPFSLILGSITLIGSCHETCTLIKEKYKAFESAEWDVLESIAKLEIIWNKTEMQMQVMRQVWNELEPSLQVSQQTSVNYLQTKLDKAVRLLKTLLEDKQNDLAQPEDRAGFNDLLKKPPQVKRTKYALLRKNDLAHLVKDFQEWANLFDPSWYFIARQAPDRAIQSLHTTTRFSQPQLNSNVTSSLTSSGAQDPLNSLLQLWKATRDLKKPPSDGNKPPPTLRIADLRPISFSTASTGRIFFTTDARLCIIDRIRPHHSADPDESLLAIKRLAKALTRMEPSDFGLLRCVALSNAQVKSLKTAVSSGDDVTDTGTVLAYDLVLQIPGSLALTQPHSLRGLLLSGQRLSVNARISIALSVARSLLYLSMTGFVHKNVRPDNVLIFHKTSRVEDPGDWSAFLVGFESFRLDEATTYRSSDELLCNEIYRHPNRQGRSPDRRYHLRHDVYSLGVVLLEIGLWTSLVDETSTVVATADRRIGSLLLSREAINIDNVAKRASTIKECLATAAQQHLPGCVGEIYTNIVMRCLDDDGWDISEGDVSLETCLQYVEEIINPLQTIVV